MVGKVHSLEEKDLGGSFFFVAMFVLVLGRIILRLERFNFVCCFFRVEKMGQFIF